MHPVSNFTAALDKQLELYRSSETIDCPKELIEKVFNNYVIVKNIIKHLPWQDKLVCKHVCTLWRSTIPTLLKEQLRQVDFSIKFDINKGIVFKKSAVQENFTAALDKQLELYRSSETIDCPKELIEKVFNNYVIVKNIIKHLPWQDKLVCKHVCTLWRSTIPTLLKEQLRQVDFSIKFDINKGIVFKKSAEFLNIPLCALVFCNTAALYDFGTVKCLALLPHPCSPPCKKEHSIWDMITRETSGPNPIMFVTKAYNVAYLPLQRSLTYDNAIKMLQPSSIPFYGGFVIPLIRDVEFITYSTPTAREHTKELIEDLRKIAEESTIKAIIVNVTDHNMLFLGNGNDSFLDCFRDIQPHIPFALGGCLVEDTFTYLDEIIAQANNEIPRIVCKQVSLAIFSVSKEVKVKPSFDVFTCVIEKAAWTKQQIQDEIREFSRRIPHYDNSVALKMACAWRLYKHDTEQNYFRQFFPDTPLAGCFGNGEFGVNYPPPKQPAGSAKKSKTEIAYEHVHSHSTVFMYFGWGKIIKPAEVDTLS